MAVPRERMRRPWDVPVDVGSSTRERDPPPDSEAWSTCQLDHESDPHAAGRMSVMHAKVISDELACAAVIWNVDS